MKRTLDKILKPRTVRKFIEFSKIENRAERRLHIMSPKSVGVLSHSLSPIGKEASESTDRPMVRECVAMNSTQQRRENFEANFHCFFYFGTKTNAVLQSRIEREHKSKGQWECHEETFSIVFLPRRRHSNSHVVSLMWRWIILSIFIVIVFFCQRRNTSAFVCLCGRMSGLVFVNDFLPLFITLLSQYCEYHSALLELATLHRLQACNWYYEHAATRSGAEAPQRQTGAVKKFLCKTSAQASVHLFETHKANAEMSG